MRQQGIAQHNQARLPGRNARIKLKRVNQFIGQPLFKFLSPAIRRIWGQWEDAINSKLLD
jgi:hypothetical protein